MIPWILLTKWEGIAQTHKLLSPKPTLLITLVGEWWVFLALIHSILTLVALRPRNPKVLGCENTHVLSTTE